MSLMSDIVIVSADLANYLYSIGLKSLCYTPLALLAGPVSRYSCTIPE